MTADPEWLKINRQTWDIKTPVHVQSGFYNNESFISGLNSLNKTELEEIGDVSNKTLLHLQCHFGQDTLSWERLGAVCTGIDFSPVAISEAEKLRDLCGLKSRFICTNVYDVPKNVEGKFDIVFTSYGTIGWLPDLEAWAKVISEMLFPGGRFYIADFHPVSWMFDSNFSFVEYSYSSADPIIEKETGTYADKTSDIHTVTHTWNHGFSKIITALCKAGLKIEFLHEFPSSPYNIWQGMSKDADGMWHLDGKDDKIPLVFSLCASR